MYHYVWLVQVIVGPKDRAIEYVSFKSHLPNPMLS
jgi:hypothetical protein